MDPFHRLSQEWLFRGLLALLVATVLAFLVIAATNKPLENETAPLGIVSLQLAGTPASTADILSSWGETERILAAFNLGFDYLYLACYALVLSLACSYPARAHWRRGNSRTARIGFALAWSMSGAALLDMIENFTLLRILLGSTDAFWPRLAMVCAVPKFAIVFAGLGYAAVASGGLIWTADT